MGLHILIADSRDIFRAGLRAIFTKDSSVVRIFEAVTWEELQLQLSSHPLDIIVVHQSLITEGETLPQRRFVLLTNKPEKEVLQMAQSSQTLGYLSEEVSEALLITLLHLREVQFLIDPTLGQWVLQLNTPSISTEDEPLSSEHKVRTVLHSDHIHELLTKQEQRVFPLLCQGLTNPAIADQLCISIATIKTHVAHILRKLDMKRYELKNLTCSNGVYIREY